MPLVHESILYTSLPNSTFTDDMLVAWIQLESEYLPNKNCQMLQIGSLFFLPFPFPKLVINHLADAYAPQ